MDLRDYTRAARQRLIREAVDVILGEGGSPLSTYDLAEAIAKRLGTTGNVIAKDIVAVAATHPRAAKTGEEYIRFGKPMRRWLWTPEARTETPRERAERLAAVGQPKTEEW